jgi:putative oxidoreductase
VITNGSAIRRTRNEPIAPTGRGAQIALRVVQIALAAMFIVAGGSKLLGAAAMVDLFNAIGFGRWFRYLTGAIETGGAVMLLIPSAAVCGALLLIPTMIGAVATNLLLGQSPVPPLVLLIGVSGVAWARRGQLQSVFSR